MQLDTQQTKAFLKLNEAMALRFLLDQAQALELQWQQPEAKQTALSFFSQYCALSGQHKSKTVQRFAKFEKLLADKQLSYEQFLAILVPLERELSRAVVDHEFLGDSPDAISRDLAAIAPIELACINLRSAFNIGSLFRTAEGLGLSKINLCGYSSTPDHPKVKKTCMGTDEFIPWQSYAKTEDLLELKKRENNYLIAIETSSSAVSVYDFKIPQGISSLCLLLGNERHGLDESILKQADSIVNIPMYGAKNSLNVGCALAIAASQIRQLWQLSKE